MRPMTGMARRRLVTLLMSVLTFSIVVGVNFDQKVHATHVKAFGEHPFGLPVLAVVSIVEVFLYIPIPFFFWHYIGITMQAHADGRLSNPFYLLTVDALHPELRRSKIVCLWGLAYFIVLCATWIMYAESRGI
jgi:hypothetical protein